MSASDKKKLRKEQNAQLLTEKQLQQQKEDKALKRNTFTFIVVMALVVCIAIGTVAVTAINRTGFFALNTDAVTIGEHTLNSAQLAYYYVDMITKTYESWQEEYGEYTTLYVGLLHQLDMSKPLDEQYFDKEKDITFAEHFAELAIDDARGVYALCDDAAKNGYKLTEEDIANVEESIEIMELYAQYNYGFEDLASYLTAMYGFGASEESYREYLEHTQLAKSYFNNHYKSLSYTEDQLRAHEKDRYDEYSSFSYSCFWMSAADFLTGGTKDENGKTTYSKEELTAAQKAVEDAAKSLEAIKVTTTDELKAAVKTLAPYKDSTTLQFDVIKDKLYDNLDSYVKEWVSSSERKVGDYALLPHETTNTDDAGTETKVLEGYHVILFQGKNENNMSLVNVRHILKTIANGTQGEDGTVIYKDEDKKAAKDKLTAVYDEWKAGAATEESFIALVEKNTSDSSTKETGGLFENVYPGGTVQAFNDWCFAENRKPGDVEIIESSSGYHLMYYVGETGVSFRDYMIDVDLRTEDTTKWNTSIEEKVTATNINISRLPLDYIIASNTSTGY